MTGRQKLPGLEDEFMGGSIGNPSVGSRSVVVIGWADAEILMFAAGTGLFAKGPNSVARRKTKPGCEYRRLFAEMQVDRRREHCLQLVCGYCKQLCEALVHGLSSGLLGNPESSGSSPSGEVSCLKQA
jgi:hypothetical protein